MELLSKSEAKLLGKKRYFTGKPCRHEHVVERYMSTGACCACQKKRDASPKTRSAKKKYNAAPERKATNKKRDATPEAKVAREKYQATPEAKAARKKYNAKLRLKITKATPTTMEQAKLLGEKFYFTGEPCEYDHFNFRDVSGGECCACDVQFQKDVKKGVELYDEMF